MRYTLLGLQPKYKQSTNFRDHKGWHKRNSIKEPLLVTYPEALVLKKCSQ